MIPGATDTLASYELERFLKPSDIKFVDFGTPYIKAASTDRIDRKRGAYGEVILFLTKCIPAGTTISFDDTLLEFPVVPNEPIFYSFRQFINLHLAISVIGSAAISDYRGNGKKTNPRISALIFNKKEDYFKFLDNGSPAGTDKFTYYSYPNNIIKFSYDQSVDSFVIARHFCERMRITMRAIGEDNYHTWKVTRYNEYFDALPTVAEGAVFGKREVVGYLSSVSGSASYSEYWNQDYLDIQNPNGFMLLQNKYHLNGTTGVNRIDVILELE